MKASSRRLTAALLLGGAACHNKVPTFGPNPARTAADCAAVIAKVRAETSLVKAPRPGMRVFVIPPQPPPASVQGRSATLWIPVDERGRVDARGVRLSGIPDAVYARSMKEGMRRSEWSPAVKDGCWVPGWAYLEYAFPRASLYVSIGDTAQAAAVAQQRMAEHGQGGLSLDDIHRTRAWFSDDMFRLLVADRSDGVGYVNFDPFLDAQDDVGPIHYDSVSFVPDTFKVSFSRKGYGNEIGRIQLAMRYVNGAWRIANFLYPDHARCHRDLARAMQDFAARLNPDSVSCNY